MALEQRRAASGGDHAPLDAGQLGQLGWLGQLTSEHANRRGSLSASLSALQRDQWTRTGNRAHDDVIPPDFQGSNSPHCSAFCACFDWRFQQ